MKSGCCRRLDREEMTVEVREVEVVPSWRKKDGKLGEIWLQ